MQARRHPPAPRDALVIACFSVLLGACAAESSDIARLQAELEVCANGPTLMGIDVSHWQGTIDWDAVKGAGVQYAFIRVSDGTGTLDKQFARNWAEAKRVGIKRGVYQFFRPNQDPIAQANLLISQVGTLDEGDLPPVIDVEAHDGAPPAQIAERVGQWIAHVEQAYGKPPIVYTGLYFWRDHVGSDAFQQYPLWIAQYGRQCPDIPSPWGTWAFWQTTSMGSVAGIAGDVDMNLFHGDAGALEALARGMGECGDGFCNGGETGATCEVDCPICKPVSTDVERIIDNGDVCLELGGNLAYWREEQGVGHGGSLRWTYTIAAPEAANTCTWKLEFNAGGEYRVEVHAPQPFARSAQANYEVVHGNQKTHEVVNQSAANGWVSLGEFEFAQGGSQYVRVGDNTGEPNDAKVQLACDALRVVPLDIDADDAETGGDPTKPPVGGTADDRAAGAGVSGSSCSVSPGGRGSRATAWLGGAFGLLLIARRRRSRR